MAKKQKSSTKTSDAKHKFKVFFYEWIVTLGVACAVAFFFRTTVASPRHIPTGSMIPTIKVGEFIFVTMYAYDWHIPFTRNSWVQRKDPEHGEIVVFEYPKDPDKDYIKRVIGVPGDVVEVKDKQVIVNGTPIPREVVSDKSILADLTPKYDPERMSLFRETYNGHTYYVAQMNDRPAVDMPPTTVPENSFFVMGDNRDDSLDSRYWGFVDRSKFLGRAGFTWFSFNLDHFPFLRFSRFFRMLE